MEFGCKFRLILVITVFSVYCNAATWNCSNPPPIVNPHLCCKDPKPSETAFKCSKKLNFPIPSASEKQPPGPPNMKAAACFADCILTDTKYLVNGQLDMNFIEKDLKVKYADDGDYIPVLTKAFQKCGPQAQQQLSDMERDFGTFNMGDSCSPYAALVFGCVYKELFENCPAAKWTNSGECNTAREYFQQCARKPIRR